MVALSGAATTGIGSFYAFKDVNIASGISGVAAMANSMRQLKGKASEASQKIRGPLVPRQATNLKMRKRGRILVNKNKQTIVTMEIVGIMMIIVLTLFMKSAWFWMECHPQKLTLHHKWRVISLKRLCSIPRAAPTHGIKFLH